MVKEGWWLFEASYVKSMNIQTPSIDYVIAMVRDLGEWQVTFDLNKKPICCSVFAYFVKVYLFIWMSN